MARIFVALVFSLFAAFARAQSCSGFADGLQLQGADGLVYASITFDDGSGPQAYIGGDFRFIGDFATNAIARWDGTHWSDVGGGFGGISGGKPVVRALAAMHGKLFAAGEFTVAGGVPVTNIAVWDGTSWSALPGSPDGGISSLCAFQSDLVAGGYFLHAGGHSCNGVARFHFATGTWSPLGNGFSGANVMCLASYTDAAGEGLYAGGRWVGIPGGGSSVCRFDGVSWSSVGMLTSGPYILPTVQTMLVHDDGAGPELWVGGCFSSVGGTAAGSIAKWNGNTWSAVGLGGADWNCSCAPTVCGLAHFDDGSGSAIYVGGLFPSMDSLGEPNLARYRNGVFEHLGLTPDNTVNTLVGFGTSLIVGGELSHIGALHCEHLARVVNGTWHTSANGGAPGGNALGLCSFDVGGGPTLYAVFGTLGHVLGMRFGRWTQGAWTELPKPSAESAFTGAIVGADDGSGAGPSLFIGGWGTDAQGVYQQGVARWNPTGWSWLAPIDPVNPTYVSGLAVFDSGSGPQVFACGNINVPGPGLGSVLVYIGAWDGTTWTPISAGFDGLTNVLLSYDDGHGAALYAGGGFSMAAGSPAMAIAKWDGFAWSALGSGIENTPGNPGTILALASFDDGTGPGLYVAGRFQYAGGVPVHNIARWKNGAWSDVGGGVDARLGSSCPVDVR